MIGSRELFLCIDIGGDSIKASEFYSTSDGNLILYHFAYCEYGADNDDSTFDDMLDALQEIIVSNDFAAKQVNISISGQASFSRFVKVPSMTSDRSKIKELIAYEARQTIPFPMDEVVWDSQLIEPTDPEDVTRIDAMLVIVKKDFATRICERVEALGMKVNLIEVGPTACYNAARANMVGNSQCEMILNIGGKCSTLIFVDGGQFFVRTIPIAGNTITQQIAKEFNIPYANAEEMKRVHGFVALGGAYEEPDSEVAATVSKIVRNVMTRLHGEINRSINEYRASRHGRKPEKLLLTGGSSILAFAPRFFQEKLRIPVEYFNPFQVVTLDENINPDDLKDVAHLFSEMTGLALRQIGTPPISITLLPDSVKKQHSFQLKRPYFYASAISLVAYLWIALYAMSQQLTNIQAKRDQFKNYVEQKKTIDRLVQNANQIYQEKENQYKQIESLVIHRENWISFLDQLQRCKPKNVWFTQIAIEAKPFVQVADTAVKSAAEQSYEEDFMPRRGSFMIEEAEEAAAQKNASKTDNQWLNLEGYIVCEKGRLDKLPETNSAIGLLTDELKGSGLFSDTLNFNQDDKLFDVNVTKFRYTIELKMPINSKEYSQTLRERARASEKSNTQTGDL